MDSQFDHLFKKFENDQISWLWLKSQAKAESDLDPNAKSPVGALGLSQFMYATWLEWCDGTPGVQALKMIYDRKNPEHSIRAQASYMKYLINFFQGNKFKAFASYNCGMGTVQRKIKKSGQNYFDYLPKETRDYVLRIQRIYSKYVNEGVV